MTTTYTSLQFTPTRSAALEQLDRFKKSMGHTYAQNRNFDFGPNNRTNTSLLSPYISTRLLLEEEVISTALSAYSYEAAEKFIQEVFWRTYWKGWLEMRPSVWSDYLCELSRLHGLIQSDTQLSTNYEAAICGKTQLDCFNAWIQELVSTGYLHNHARMWFASIWMYTLKLPWELGAEFFLQHLLDGDVASNTLSWRWVAGLHTKGKQYIATAENIGKYTQGRFNPEGLELNSTHTAQIMAPYSDYEAVATPAFPAPDPIKKSILLIHNEDLYVEASPIADLNIREIIALGQGIIAPEKSFSANVNSFKDLAFKDQIQRAEKHFGKPVQLMDSNPELHCFLEQIDVESTQLVCLRPKVGFWRDYFHSMTARFPAIAATLREVERTWDTVLYPHATGGFFKFKKAIPKVIRQLGISERS